MKTSAFIILLTFLGLQSAWSQIYFPFPDSNATWCDERYDNGFPVNYYYNYYKTDGKLSINDTVYTVISDNYGYTRCYLREENRKVFCRLGPGMTEFLLYDFDIEVGDSISLYQISGGQFYAAYVAQIDSLLIGPQYHTRYYIECPEWLSVDFIEGVGSSAGLMYCDIPWVDIWGNLYCFSLNDAIYKTDGTGYSTPGDCWDYIGISEEIPDQAVVFPNPVSECIHLDFQGDCRLELVDLAGKLCRQSFSNSMNVQDLEQGLYILKACSASGTFLKQFKILKLNAR